MATEEVFIGTKLKRNINIDPIGNITMDEYDFIVEFISDSPNHERVVVTKNDAKRVDSNNYIVPVDTTQLAAGYLICIVTAHIPDTDFADGTRTEIVEVDTGIELVEKP